MSEAMNHSFLNENMRILKVVQPSLYEILDDCPLAHEDETVHADDVYFSGGRPASAHVAVVLDVNRASRFYQALNFADVPLVVVDHRPGVLKACLVENDLSELLLQGNLRFHVLALSDVVARELSLRFIVVQLMDFLMKGLSVGWILPQNQSHDAYLQIVHSVKISTERTLQLSNSACYSRDHVWDVTVVSPFCAIFDDLARCFSQLGLRTQIFRVPDQAQVWTPAQKMGAIEQLRQQPSRLLIGRNRTLFETEQLGDALRPEQWVGQDYVAWWWDTPNPSSYLDFQLPIARGIRHLAFAHALMPVLPPMTQWLPAGARSQFLELATHRENPPLFVISFVGQTRFTATYRNWIELGGVLASMGESMILPKLDPQAGPLWSYHQLCDCRVELDAAVARAKKYFPMHGYFIDYARQMCETGLFRMAAIEQIIKLGLPLKIWGDEDWLKVPGVTTDHYAGVLDPQHLAQVYTQSQVNLNLNYMQVSSTVNPKVLDIAAAGAVVVTDHRPELDVLYPDPTCRPLAFNALAELPEVLDFALHHDLEDHSRQIQHYTRQQHTLLQRAEWIARQFHLMD